MLQTGKKIHFYVARSISRHPKNVYIKKKKEKKTKIENRK